MQLQIFANISRKDMKEQFFTKTARYKMQFLFTSFDMCWAGDQLVKLLSDEEPGKEESLEYQLTLHSSKLVLKLID